MVPGSRNAGLTFSRPPVEPGFGDSQAVERETLGKTSFSGLAFGCMLLLSSRFR